MAGRRLAAARWHHRIHLLPGWLLSMICDRFDLSLGLTQDELERKAPEACMCGTSWIGSPGLVLTCGCGGRIPRLATTTTQVTL